VLAVIPHAFDVLRLHRIEAAAQPENIGSVRLLERCGFEREGLARRYLKINGEWQDHLLFALLADDRAVRGLRKT
jgi:[ribosomal protein S5]-alanine N-acetyltransferase